MSTKRKRYLFVCTNRRDEGVPKGSCAARGASDLHATLKAELKARGLADLEVRACTASCLDVCWAGPVIAVEPDDYFYGRVRPEDLPELLQSLADGTRVERLVLQPDDFIEPRELKSKQS
jgi:(2Fe-2S) ferredoxin